MLLELELVQISLTALRNLYVAVDFYGRPMDTNDTVWRGVSEKMFFTGFSAYFDCPTSTTTEMSVAAATFAGHGRGIVLELASRQTDSPCRALDVTRFSRYPSGSCT